MKKHTRIITVEYVVRDCHICGKVIVKHHLYPEIDKKQEKLRRWQRR
uniref:MqsA n=1 Tax=Siphoviridae sp. ct4Uy2 TaxID=2827777 RepID=A0A8S5SJF6_9CAUD|nr:MAG TPA: MqsA [Siphoviridae sp. ct4Uy2]DAL94128.1 MAG TPA: MqsA [Caudoviricetes sp.]